MKQDELPAYLRRIMVSVDQITTTVSSMAADILMSGEAASSDSFKVSVSDEAKLKACEQARNSTDGSPDENPRIR